MILERARRTACSSEWGSVCVGEGTRVLLGGLTDTIPWVAAPEVWPAASVSQRQLYKLPLTLRAQR